MQARALPRKTRGLLLLLAGIVRAPLLQLEFSRKLSLKSLTPCCARGEGWHNLHWNSLTRDNFKKFFCSFPSEGAFFLRLSMEKSKIGSGFHCLKVHTRLRNEKFIIFVFQVATGTWSLSPGNGETWMGTLFSTRKPLSKYWKHIFEPNVVVYHQMLHEGWKRLYCSCLP